MWTGSVFAAESCPEPERTLTLLAAGTGLRISECLGLQWHDVDFADQRIHVRRTWVHGRLGSPKTKASKAPVPMHSLLADFDTLIWPPNDHLNWPPEDKTR
jgi:integrase